jgi:hypothetical protein
LSRRQSLVCSKVRLYEIRNVMSFLTIHSLLLSSARQIPSNPQPPYYVKIHFVLSSYLRLGLLRIFFVVLRPNAGHGLLILEVSLSHTTTHLSRLDSSGRMMSSSQRPLPDSTQHSQQTNIHAPGGIRNHDLSRRAAADLRLRPHGHWDRPSKKYFPSVYRITNVRFPANVCLFSGTYSVLPSSSHTYSEPTRYGSTSRHPAFLVSCSMLFLTSSEMSFKLPFWVN